ncbi:helix-turn-helix domain-containing protein [Actinoplanes sp. CA-015351]|uniref:helix-turn-helix domain-containing protein n=1 Tax=Actinoplanes sp. CA-015351 TaxID=3239897 RepID=UPI003D977FD0
MRSSGLWDQPEHLLLWVRTGSACIRMEGTPEFRLAEGEGVWIPSDGGKNRWTVDTEPGTVAFPLLAHPKIAAEDLSEPRLVVIPDGWQDWLIQHFNLMVTPLTSHEYSQDALVDLLRGSGRRPLVPHGDTGTSAVDLPVMPRASGARVVADELLRNPALDLTVAEWAARVLSSPRTLLRDFRADTGLTFEQWRLRCRLNAAVEFLVAGYEVDQAAARVGFASRSGFTRAFRQQFGSTPYEFSRTLAAQRVFGDHSQRATAARQANDLVTMVRDGRGSPDAPALLPATRTTPHTNNFHVLSWVYRGSGYLDIGDRHYERGRGVATWIPAGVEHVTGLRANSVSLPIGNATTGELQLTEPLQTQFSPAWDDYLMFCAISSRTPMRPDDYNPSQVLEPFADQLAARRALSLPMPTGSRARGAAMDYLRRIGTSGGSALDVPADIHRAFREQTGMTFARWRYAARMHTARDLLAGGAKPSAVARRVGYAHLPTFSSAFTRFHGLSPRDYAARQVDQPPG